MEIVSMKFGSHLYGTATPASDTDLKAVHIPARRDLLLQRAKQVISAHTKKDIVAKNGADDVDRESYALHKYLALAAEGQTVALDMLFAPEWAWLSVHPLWHEVRANKDRLLSRQYASFVGYCRTQANKYGIKGSRMAAAKKARDLFHEWMYRDASRNRVGDCSGGIGIHLIGTEHVAIIEAESGNPRETCLEVCGRRVPYGATVKTAFEIFDRLYQEYGQRSRDAESNENIDWKALSHAVRIGRQAVELLQTGNVIFPRPDAAQLLEIKTGQREYKEVAAEIEALLDSVVAQAGHSKLRNGADREWIDDFVAAAYEKLST